MGSVIGASVLIKGQIVSREDLRLEGEAEGRLDVDGRLTVGQQGKARCDITAKEVVMSGQVHGNIEASDRVVLTKGAELTGDVKTAGIVIEDGAYFKGGIDIIRPGAGKTETSAASPQPAAAPKPSPPGGKPPSTGAHSAGQ